MAISYLLLAATATAISAASIGDKRTLQLEQIVGTGDSWAPRCSVDFEAVAAAGSGIKWKASATTAGSVTEEEAQRLAVGLAHDSFLRVRARMDGGNTPWVVGSTRLCALAAASWKHDIVFAMDAEGALHSIEVRPGLPADGFPGCRATAAAGQKAPAPPAGGIAWATRFGVAAIEDAPPVAAAAFKGVPFPGQREVTQTEALAATLGGAAATDPNAKAALEEAQRRERAEAEAKKSFWERYSGYIIPIGIALVIQSVLGGAAGAQQGQQAAGAGGRPAAAARATR